MLFIFNISYFDVAPFLPASVALMYVAFITFGWEKSLNRRFHGTPISKREEKQSLLPVDKAQPQLLKDREQTYTSHLINAALPILHTNLTVGRLCRVDRSKKVSLELCAIQLALIVAEYVLDGLRHRSWKRMDLLLLGIAWCDLRIHAISPEHSAWDIIFSLLIAMVGISSILLPDPPATSTQRSSEQPEKDLIAGGLPQPGRGMRHFHIFSVSLLLVHLLYDYPVLSSWLLGYAPWMGSFSNFYIPFGLIYLHNRAQEWYKTTRQDQSFLQHVKAFASRAYASAPEEARYGIVLPLLTLGYWLLFFFATSYLTSCLGFRYLVLGSPRTTPQFLDGGRLGGYFYFILFAVYLLRRGEKIKADRPGGTYHFVLTAIAAFGQTVTGLTAVAAVVYVLQAV